MQKHIRARDINLRLPDIAFLMDLAQLSEDQGKSLLRYLAQETNTLDSKTFLRILVENTPRYRDEMMTLAEHLKLEGRDEGRNEGRSEQAREIARNLLSMGLDHTTIERATGLSNIELDALMDLAVRMKG
ncbi:hypothetical protein [Sodalis sp. RH16]|uniref:hypothetical protein n=1 Tax=Sodalis sp. RH16 TaxID=3394331 RepID=UPI0039B4E8D8